MKKKHLTILTLPLLPFAVLYGAAVSIRNLLFEWGILPVREFPLPVISVGNISVGGTGKTPHIEYLTNLLMEEFKLAILSRGYMRKTRHFIIAGIESSVSDIGDEPRQLKQKFPALTVAVDRRRVNGIVQLMKLPEKIDIILLDDAYQHRYVKPGVSILLIDYNRLIQDDFLLPAGMLREPASGIDRANIILITRSPERAKPIELRNVVTRMKLGLHQHLFFTTMDFGQFLPVYEIPEPRDVSWFRENKSPLLLLAGIANPRALRRYARSISTRFSELSYPDHYQYTPRDLDKITREYRTLNDPGALLLTTEKDAMRLQELNPDNDIKNALYYITIHVRFLNDDAEEFNNLIRNYVRSNKRDNILHQKAV